MQPALSLSPEAYVPINKLREGKCFGFSIIFETTVTGTWDIIFSTDEAGKQPVIILISGSGFTISDNVITVFVGSSDNNLKYGKAWIRVSQTVAGSSSLAFIGPVNVLP